MWTAKPPNADLVAYGLFNGLSGFQHHLDASILPVAEGFVQFGTVIEAGAMSLPRLSHRSREIGLAADPADQPTTDGVIAALERHDLTGRRVGVQLYPRNANERFLKFLESVRKLAAALTRRRKG